MNKFYHRNLPLVEAQEFIAEHHRHSPPLKRHRYSIGVFLAKDWVKHEQGPWVPLQAEYDQLVGVATIDQPSSSYSADFHATEIRRVCTDGENNVCSILYGKACQASFAMGFQKVITYTQPHEGGASLLGSNFYIDPLQEQPAQVFRWIRTPRPVTEAHRKFTKALLQGRPHYQAIQSFTMKGN